MTGDEVEIQTPDPLTLSTLKSAVRSAAWGVPITTLFSLVFGTTPIDTDDALAQNIEHIRGSHLTLVRSFDPLSLKVWPDFSAMMQDIFEVFRLPEVSGVPVDASAQQFFHHFRSQKRKEARQEQRQAREEQRRELRNYLNADVSDSDSGGWTPPAVGDTDSFGATVEQRQTMFCLVNEFLAEEEYLHVSLEDPLSGHSPDVAQDFEDTLRREILAQFRIVMKYFAEDVVPSTVRRSVIQVLDTMPPPYQLRDTFVLALVLVGGGGTYEQFSIEIQFWQDPVLLGSVIAGLEGEFKIGENRFTIRAEREFEERKRWNVAIRRSYI